jgi:hypothetical protein
LRILGVSVQHFKRLDGCADFYVLSFGVVYLLMRLRDKATESIVRFCANLGKSALKTLEIIRQAFGGKNMSCLNEMLGSGQTERKGMTGEEQRACSSLFFDIKRIA